MGVGEVNWLTHSYPRSVRIRIQTKMTKPMAFDPGTGHE